MHLNTHLDFNGNCAEAFRVYADVLGGTVTTLLTYGDSPAAAQFPDLADKIIHATLQLPGGGRLTGVDVDPARYQPPRGFSVQLNLADPAHARRVYDTLTPGGRIHMSLAKTFWAELFAVLTDRFGTPWEINCSGSVPDPTAAELP